MDQHRDGYSGRFCFFSGEAALRRYMNEKPILKGESLITGDMWSAILIDGIIDGSPMPLFSKLRFCCGIVFMRRNTLC